MSQAMLDRLHGQYRSAVEELRSTIDAADAEKRDLTPEEAEKCDRITGDIDGLSQRIGQLTEAEKRIASGDDMDKRMADIAGRQPKVPNDPARPTENDQIRSLARGEIRELRLTGGTVEQRDQLVGTATAGGNLVPTTFFGRLVEHMIEVSAILQANPTIVRTSGGESITVPKTTAYGTAALVAEAAAIPESDAAFGQATLAAYKYGRLVQISRELMEDSAFDIAGFIARDAGRSVGNAFGAHLVTGTGTAQPQGVVTAASAGVTGAAATAGAFTADNLIDLMYSVISPYRNSPSAAFLMRDATLANLMKLKDGDGRYLVNPITSPGAAPSLWGKPIYTDPNVAAVAADAVSVIFGDFSQYFVRIVNDIRLDRSDDYAFGNDLVTFRCTVRGDGRLVDTTGAVKKFTGGAAA